jgi:hypothetical protein
MWYLRQACLSAAGLGGVGGVIVTFLKRADPKEIDCAIVSCTYVGVALLHQLHPTVCEGVVLLLLASVVVRELVLHGVGVDCFMGVPV